MARWIKAAGAALLAGLLAGTANAAVTKAPGAAASGSPVIAVLDVQLVLRSAVAAKGIRTAMDARRKAEQRRGTLNRAFVGATRKLRNEIAKVLSQLMAERKITITLARTAVLVFDQRLSVTGEVLKRLDKNLPNVTVDFKNPDAK